MKRALTILFLSIAVIACVFMIQPFKKGNTKSKQARGIVSSVYLSAQKELVCKIEGFKASFRLNGQAISNIETFEDALLGKNVEIWYSDSWTPLDPGSKKEIDQLRVDERVLYGNDEP